MHSVLYFKNTFYYDGCREVTIRGEHFRALIELCFSHADLFSLHRCSWQGAQDGALEQALRPYLVGEYLSFGTLCWFDKEYQEKCYLYQATQETKELLLQHIHHLFDTEKSLAPAGHEAFLRKKYAVYDRAGQEASSCFQAYLDAVDRDTAEDQGEAVWKEVAQNARKRCPDVFAESDYYSHMEDLCFFRNREAFFVTITHEQDCWVQILSPEFQRTLRKLGRWVASNETPLPLLSLDSLDGFKWYGAAHA